MFTRSTAPFSQGKFRFNTVESLYELSRRVDAVFREELEEPYELILVEDCSPNRETWPAIEAVCAQNSRARGIRLMRNFGQSPATICGLDESRGEIVITMDDDLQHRPEDIPRLIERSDHDVVVGALAHKKHSPFKRMTSWIKGGFDRIILGKPRDIKLSSFRVMKRDVVEGMLRIHTPSPFIPALMFYVTRDVVNVTVEHQARREGRTGYSLFKMIRLFSNLVINNSSLMLRLIGYLGVLISATAFGIGLYFFIRRLLYGNPEMGWTSLIVSVLFIGGLTLFSIGVLGEYLVRITQGVEQKPTYLIREKRERDRS